MIFNKNVKALFFACGLAIFAASAFSFDFGGSIRNNTKFKGSKFSNIKLDQVDDINLWARFPISKDGKTYFIAEGLYEFELADTTVFNRLDLDLFKFAGAFKVGKRALNVSAGRFIYSDLTGLVYSQNGDGLYVNYDGGNFAVSAYAAYTGLLNAALVKMLDHPSDSFVYDTKAVYELAQKYIVGAATFSLPALAGSHSLSAQFLGAFKLDGKSYNRLYGTACITGPIVKTLYYTLSTTMGFQSFDGGSFDISNMSSAKVSYFLPFKDMTINCGGLYASGSHGPFEPFRAFTKIDAYNSLTEPQHSGIIKGSFSATIKPIQTLLAYAGCDVIINAATSSLEYKGIQYNVGADWQIFSDLKTGVAFLQYIDNDNSDYNKIQIALNVTLTF
ncbi:MAG: hypothetical protein K6A42_00040 [Treponema sp.]|nr:hypothetical protein [Treponema sp.]